MRTFFSLLFILSLHFLSAQSSPDLILTKSTEYFEKVKTDSIISFYTTNKGESGIVRDSKKNFVFDVFDESLTKVFSENHERNKKEEIVKSIKLGNEIRIFTQIAYKKNERILNCHIFNIVDRSYKKVEIFKTVIDGKQALYSEIINTKSFLSVSPNGNNVGVVAKNHNKDENSYFVQVFDLNSLGKIYTNEVVMDSNQHFKIKEIFVDNDATVFWLGKLFKEGKFQKKAGKPNYNFVVKKTTKNTDSELILGMNDMYVETLSITQKQKELHLLGLFSEKKVDGIKGGCSFIVNSASLSLIRTNRTNFSSDVYKKIYREKSNIVKKEKELFDYTINQVLHDESGGTYYIAEKYFSESHYSVEMMSSGGGPTMFGTRTPKFYGNLIILKFEVNGNIEWSTALNKKSIKSSCNAYLKNEELHFLLNSGKNIKEKKDGRIVFTYGLKAPKSLYSIVFSSSGKLSYSKILDYEDKDRYLPNIGSYHAGRFIMMNSHKKKKHFAILE